MDKKRELKHYKALIYYSGYIEQEVLATDEDSVLRLAEECVNAMPEGKFMSELKPTLERWEEADTVEEIEDEV